MGLRCLLGHDFDEPEIERDREENGDEVVISVREVKTCSRCGETQVVSENKEVTTIQQLADEAAVADAQAEAEAEVRADAEAPDDPSAPAPDASDEEPVDVEGGFGGGATDAAGVAESADSPAEEDATIIDADTADSAATGTEAGDELPDEETASDPASAGSADSARKMDGTDGIDETGSAVDGDVPDDGGVELLGDDDEEDATLGGADDLAEEGPTGVPGESDGPGGSGAAASDADDEAEADDGVILDEEGEEPVADRERGAWPEVEGDDGSSSDPTPWPEQRGEDEGFSASTDDDGNAGVDFGGSLTPESTDEPVDEDAEFVEAPSAEDRAEFADTSASTNSGGGASAAEAGGEDATASSGEDAASGSGITRGDSPGLRTTMNEGDTEYHCPECEMTRSSDATSMRAGDICPECKRGYVTERPL